jgi:hypothetical protein
MGVNNPIFKRNIKPSNQFNPLDELIGTVMADGFFPPEIKTFTVWTGKRRLRALFAQVLGNCRFTAFD